MQMIASGLSGLYPYDAGEAGIAVGMPVALAAAAPGAVIKADAGEPARMPAIGVVARVRGARVYVSREQPVAGYSDLTPGAAYFVAEGDPGTISEEAPDLADGGTTQVIGRASSATTLLVWPGEYSAVDV